MSGLKLTCDEPVRLSVTTLADFACRTGDLDFSSVVGPSAREGLRAHQRTQKASSAEAEVRIVAISTFEDVSVVLGGRIDLLDRDAHVISEIKTTLVPAEQVPPAQRELHWSQAMLYGFCYVRCESPTQQWHPDDKLTLELCYVNLRAENTERLQRDVSVAELDSFANEAISLYVGWLRIVSRWQQATSSTAKSLAFPHAEFRVGQRDMAAAIYRSVRDAEPLLCEAPTGIGKTISCLFPIIKAMADGYLTQAVYLTAKTSGINSAMDSVRLLQDHGLEMTAVTIRSKQPTCFCSNGRCSRDDKGKCPMTIGFFDRLPAARHELIELGVIDGDALDAVAWEHQLCPFELALQLLPWVSLAICDYNYVFDPLVRLGHFNEARNETAVLIDEAHNLLDRSRNMFSAKLIRSQCRHTAEQSRLTHPVLASRLDSVTAALLQHSHESSELITVHVDAPTGLDRAVSAAIEACLEAMNQGPALTEDAGEIFRALCRYSAIRDLYGDHHRTFTTLSRDGRVKDVDLQLRCLDAADALSRQYRLFRSTVLFSATLRPAPFYRDALGLPLETAGLSLPSPFDERQAAQLVVPFIDTRYRCREASASTLVDLLATVMGQQSGNYLVFFPSYAYLQQILQEFNRKYRDIETWQQLPGSDRASREHLLARLSEPGHRLGFAIMGGVFGEGIDYAGDKLIGVMIVGVGLPGIGKEQDMIAEHYADKGLDGYDFAYRYPGFTRVLQTAGRVIRGEQDKGVIVLIDGRFNQAFYRNLFPPHWRPIIADTSSSLQTALKEFWTA